MQKPKLKATQEQEIQASRGLKLQSTKEPNLQAMQEPVMFSTKRNIQVNFNLTNKKSFFHKCLKIY